MTEYLFLLPVSVALILGVMSPGPSFVLVSQTAMSKSRSAGIAISLGMGVGSAIFTIMAALGLYVLLESVPLLYSTLKIFGGLYLCFLALRLWRHSNIPLDIKKDTVTTTGYLRLFYVGLVTQLSNPKTAIVFASVYAAFLPENMASHIYVVLCLLAFLIDGGWYVIISLLLSTRKVQNSYSKLKIYIDRMASGFMGFLGAKLIISQ